MCCDVRKPCGEITSWVANLRRGWRQRDDHAFHSRREHDTDVHKRLTQLLKEHGVWAERADERAASIMERVPQDNIRSVLAAKKPWADLKQAANQARPPVKLIMQDELEAQIAARAQHRNQFGRKPAKAPQRPPDQGKSPPIVSAVELSVPVGVFKQQDGKVLGPLQAAQVQPNAEGVVLVDQADAAAVLKLPTPVTQKGLAVLVLATKDNASMHEGDSDSFPCHVQSDSRTDHCIRLFIPIGISGSPAK